MDEAEKMTVDLGEVIGMIALMVYLVHFCMLMVADLLHVFRGVLSIKLAKF